MGVLLVLGVFVLAFLCGRLQVTVTQLRKRCDLIEAGLDALRGDVADVAQFCIYGRKSYEYWSVGLRSCGKRCV